MLTSPSFESEISFSGSSPPESLSSAHVEESFENDGRDRWGVVSESNYESEVNEGVGSDGSSVYVGPGFLILEGESGSGNEITNLSIPGTYSLPTEIDTLSVGNFGSEANDGQTITLRKRSFFICSLSMAALLTGTLGLLLWERRNLHSFTAELGQEIKRLEFENALELEKEIGRLEQEKQDIKDSCSSTPIWDDAPGEDQPDDFTIIDNCWLKAKASVQFGPCSDETKNSFNDFKTNAWRELREMWNGTSSFNKATYLATMAGLGQGSSAEDADKVRASAFPGYEAFGLSDKMFTTQAMGDKESAIKFDFEEAKASLTQASEAVSEAVLAVTEAMASSIKDISHDPVTHLAAALKSASHAAEKDPITMNGIVGAGKAFSSASVAMGKVMTETSDILSVKVSEMMEDPLSFFEFETGHS